METNCVENHVELKPANPVYPLVKKVKYVHSVEEMVDLLKTQEWVTIMGAIGTDGTTLLFLMGYVGRCQ